MTLMMIRGPLAGIAVLLWAVALTGGCGAESSSAIPLDPSQVYAVEVLGPQEGPADAALTIVEIGDFECPFCKNAATALSAVLPDYATDVRLVFMHFPLPQHSRAMPTAIAAECAGSQDRFWPFYEAAYAGAPALDDNDLSSYAADAGVPDIEAWTACLDTDAPRKVVEQQSDYASSLGIRGTPSFFFNGQYVLGSRSQEDFRALIDEHIVAARQVMEQKGIAPADYYEREVLDQGIVP